MLAKSGHLHSSAYLDFVRSLPCCICYANAPSEAHHWPPKGRGEIRDDKTMPVCRACHQLCHGATLVTTVGTKLRPISDKRQHELVNITRLKFTEHATTEQFNAYAAARSDRLEKRGGAEICPW